MTLQPASVDDVLDQAAVRDYRGIVVIGLDEHGEIRIHTSEWPEGAQQMIRVGAGILQLLMTPAEDLASA